MTKTIPGNALDRLQRVISEPGVIQATKYLSPNLVARATRRRYGKHKRASQRSLELVVNIGPPNYREREFIRRCQKAGEPFPVRKIQVRHA